MKRLIGALLALCLMLLPAGALAVSEPNIREALMVYEDYSGARAEQTIEDEFELLSLEAILLRARTHPVLQAEEYPQNSSLFCMMQDGEIYDFAVATDGSAYITNMVTDQTYALEDADLTALWEMFDEIYAQLGFEAAAVLDW